MRAGTDDHVVRRRGVLARLGAAVTTAVLVVLALGPTAQASFDPDGVATGPRGDMTDLTITGVEAGAPVRGATAPEGFDPLAGYPDAPPLGSTRNDKSFIGTIIATDTLTGQEALTYCIEINVATQVGINYVRATWDEANVPNLGYVAYILDGYYPATDEPAAAPTVDERAAAVQAAIWYFTDDYVVDADEPLRPWIAAIVADALTNGPRAEPVEPAFEVTPQVMRAPATGEIVGPFTVTADGPATLRSVGVEVFTDPEGTAALPDGAVVEPGAELWARSVSAETPQYFVLERALTVLESTVYVYDGTNPGRQNAQKLVLAEPTSLVRRAQAVLEPYAAGSLELTKVITGDGAGLQSDVLLDVVCTFPGSEDTLTRTITVPAGTAAGAHPQTVSGLPAEGECTVTERDDGDNGRVAVTATSVEPASVVVGADSGAAVTVTNDYAVAVGALQVSKSITGPRAGHQGPITLQVTCEALDGPSETVVELPAGLDAGVHAAVEITDVPAGTECTVTETGTGETPGAVLLSSAVDPDPVTVVEEETAHVLVTNEYGTASATPDSPSAPSDGGGRLPETGADPAALALLVGLLTVAGAGLLARRATS
ncbi:thioester domain-containing protein [Georgenia faecalis]|uniref:thioester domain-containing protein n=1 Tax=Georgenia faecalis TaxID=2483799 RepID=UPI000FD7B5EA|nr:thioester domain-containing protein [Georgenia faecalis]